MTLFPVCPLFVPANKLDWISKAETSKADLLVIDLEDSVPLSDKRKSRDELARHLSSSHISKPFFIRINSLKSHDGKEDISLFNIKNKNFLGLIIPKIENPIELSVLPESLKLVLLIETALALENLSLLSEDKRVIGLALGGADLSAELGSDMSWDAMLLARSMIILQASKYGLITIDSPFMQIEDINELAQESRKARSIGFNSKFAIHPKQAGVIKESFLPTKEDLEEAQKILKAFSKSKGGAISVDGKMIDEPIIKLMKKRLFLAGIDFKDNL